MLDVLVIGGGLAGATAALQARREGARVALASRSYGATAMSTGALDIAFTPALAPGQRAPRILRDHVADIIAHRQRHPYGVLGQESTCTGLLLGWEALSPVLDEAGLGVPPLDLDSENVAVASSVGAIMPAAQVLAPHAGFNLAQPPKGPWGVLQLRGDSSFNAGRIRAGLIHDAQRLYGTQIDLVGIDVAFDGGASPVVLARRLDDRAVLDKLCDVVSKEVRGKGLAGLLAPPVLGFSRHVEARQCLQEAASVPVVEALAHLPSVPGMRLQRALVRALENADVRNVGEVAGIQNVGDRLQTATTRDSLRIDAGAFVLATGRFVAGGVVWNDACREALLDLPVVTELGLMEEECPESVVRERPVESHPLMTAGVPVNAMCQPLCEGHVAFRNLFAAGMIIGGFASRYALCADGVALATGALAAKGALGEAGMGGA